MGRCRGSSSIRPGFQSWAGLCSCSTIGGRCGRARYDKTHRWNLALVHTHASAQPKEDTVQVKRLTQTSTPDTFLPRSREANLGIRAFTTAIGNEISKGLIDLWRGKLASLLELILVAVFFLATIVALGGVALYRGA